MLLVLRIQYYRNAPASNQPPAQFSIAGGTIGRSPGHDLVLDDPGKYISRTHARIDFRDGQFYLADLGSNPSVVNDRPLGKGRDVALATGDRIAIGDYQLEVQVSAAAADATFVAGADPLGLGSPAIPASNSLPSIAEPPDLPLFEPPPPRPPVVLPPLDAFNAPAYGAAAPTGLPPSPIRDPLAEACILDTTEPARDGGFQADPLGLNLLGTPPGSGSPGSGFGGDDPLGLRFRGSVSDHAAPERYALPAAPTHVPAPTWPTGGIPEDYDPLADFFPKERPPQPAPVSEHAPVAPPASPASTPILPGMNFPTPSPSAAPPEQGAGQYPSGAPASKPPARSANLSVPPKPVDEARTPPFNSGTHATPGGDATLEALLRGLGLPDLKTRHAGPELAELVGAMLREATGGAMQTLMARSVTKRESRIEMTMIALQANNPLKFFPDAGSALNQMLSQTGAGYMKPVRAFANAFEDLQAHELAVMAGMHAALAAILARFDPAAIEKRLDVPSVMDKMMASSRKAKMWDRLVLLYADITREADEDFQQLFGESFAKAYEDQVERLHGRGK